jgi:hypothetical protein
VFRNKALARERKRVLPRLRPLACFIMIQAPLAAVMGATIAAAAMAGFANNGKIAFTPLEY